MSISRWAHPLLGKDQQGVNVHYFSTISVLQEEIPLY